MKTITREQAIIAMVEGKQVTSDEFTDPDNSYCIYDKRYTAETELEAIIKLTKFIAKEKELI